VNKPLISSVDPSIDRKNLLEFDVVLKADKKAAVILSCADDEHNKTTCCIDRHPTANAAQGSKIPDEDEYRYYQGQAIYDWPNEGLARFCFSDRIVIWHRIYKLCGATNSKCLGCNPCRMKRLSEDFHADDAEFVAFYNLPQGIPIDLSVDRQIELIFDRAILLGCNATFAKHYGQPIERLVGVKLNTLPECDYPNLHPKKMESVREFIKNGYCLDRGFASHGVVFTALRGTVENGHLVHIWSAKCLDKSPVACPALVVA
jgi:hypothetical protein